MNATFKAAKPEGIVIKCELEMTIAEWRRLNNQLRDSDFTHPASALTRMIGEQLERVEKHFIADAKVSP